MKTIVIADIHEQVPRVRTILEREVGYNKAIFTGDYFDVKSSPPSGPVETLKLVLELIEDTRNVLLVGNHDMQYLYPGSPAFFIPRGYRMVTQKEIDTVRDELHANLHYLCISDGILFSHAGVTDKLFSSRVFSTSEDTSAFLKEKLAEAFKIISNGEDPAFLGCGYSRGGWHSVGGILWCDLTEMYPPVGLKQIVGHSQVKSPVLIRRKSPEHEKIVVSDFSDGTFVAPPDWVLANDTGLNTYLRIEDRLITIVSTDSGEVLGSFRY